MGMLADHLTITAAFISIFGAVMITMIGVGVQKPGKVVDATTSTNLYQAFGATSNIIFAYGKFPSYTFSRADAVGSRVCADSPSSWSRCVLWIYV